MDWISVNRLVERLKAVDAVARHVHHAPLDLLTSGHRNRRTETCHFKATLQSVGIIHGYTANCVFANVLLHFYNNGASVWMLHRECLMNSRKHFLKGLSVGFKRHIDHRTDDLGNAPPLLFFIITHCKTRCILKSLAKIHFYFVSKPFLR